MSGVYVEQEQTERFLPVLIYIQSHLAEDLSLATLARRADLSAYHFHRRFQAAVGETPRQYVQRLRLERAACCLKIQEAAVLEIALNNGFHSHESFSRAFKRWFGVSPRQFRASFGRHWQRPASGDQQLLNRLAGDYKLSRVTIQKLRPIPVAFMRHLGPYLEVDVTLFDRLIAWADARGFYTENNLLLGVGHDDPAITPAGKLRFDACLSVAEAFAPENGIGYQTIPGGHYASASYIGPFGPTMTRAYGELFAGLMQLPDIEIIGLPLLEIYRATRINPHYALNHTDVFVPVRKLGEAR